MVFLYYILYKYKYKYIYIHVYIQLYTYFVFLVYMYLIGILLLKFLNFLDYFGIFCAYLDIWLCDARSWPALHDMVQPTHPPPPQGRGEDKLTARVLYTFYTSCSNANTCKHHKREGAGLPLLTYLGVCQLKLVTVHSYYTIYIYIPMTIGWRG